MTSILLLISCQNEELHERKDSYRNVTDVENLIQALHDRDSGALSSRSNTTVIESRVTGEGEIPYYLANYTMGTSDERWVIVSADKRMLKALAWGVGENSVLNLTTLGGVKDWDERIVAVFDSLQTISTENLYPDNHPDSILARAIIPCNNDSQDPNDPIVEYPCDTGGNVTYSDGECSPHFYTYGTPMSTTWGQNCPYSVHTPTNSCANRCMKDNQLTGCVATAGAQIAKFHAKPYSNVGYPQYNMNYSAMLNNYTRSSAHIAIAESDGNVGRLMRHAGNRVDMDYGCSASGAQMKDLRNLYQDLSYSHHGGIATFNLITVANDVESGFPVVLGGFPINGDHGGHALVCDAWAVVGFSDCSSQTQLNMNWGWGNHKSNGWFVWDNWDPNTNGFDFNVAKEMLYDIRP